MDSDQYAQLHKARRLLSDSETELISALEKLSDIELAECIDEVRVTGSRGQLVACCVMAARCPGRRCGLPKCMHACPCCGQQVDDPDFNVDCVKCEARDAWFHYQNMFRNLRVIEREIYETLTASA